MSTEATTRNLLQERIGTVTSNKMDKSIVVSVERKEKHPEGAESLSSAPRNLWLYDEEQTRNIGDTVRIAETRPRASASAGDWSRSSRRSNPRRKKTER